MSIKIYHGYILSVPQRDFGNLDEFFRRLAPAVRDEAERLAATLQAGLVSEYLDFKSLRIPGATLSGDSSPLMLARSFLKEKLMNTRAGFREPLYDLEMRVRIFTSGRKILCYVGTEQDSLRQIFEAQPEVRPYPYWNSSDRPDDVSARQWRQRKKDWEQSGIMGNGSPSFVITLSPDDLACHLDRNKILDSMPTLSERSGRAASETFVSTYMRRLAGEEALSGADIVTITGLYRQACEHMKSPEGILELKRLSDEYAVRLKKEITPADLLEQTKNK